MHSESEVDNADYIPPELLEAADIAVKNSLPDKSKHIYRKCYNNFTEWQTQKKTKSFDEKVLLAYFFELSKTISSATLWSKYSMIRAMINAENDIDISKYSKLRSFLKQNHTSYKPKKAKVLTPENIDKFLKDAPDTLFLATKIALILGITGACRSDELHKLTMDDIRIENSILIIKIPDTKTHISRTFTVEGRYFELVKKYIDSRPCNVGTNKFFLSYRKGKCVKQVIGKNKIGSMPQEIASFLNLPDAKLYTGHSFRRTSTTLLANTGADITTIKRHGGWQSSTVAEGYIDESIGQKRKISNLITNSIDDNPALDQEQATSIKKMKTDNNDHADNKDLHSNKTTNNQNNFQFTFHFNNNKQTSTITSGVEQ